MMAEYEQPPGTIRSGPGPSDDQPPTPRTVQGDECPGCRTHQIPPRWYEVLGGTIRGEALGLEDDDRVEICAECEERLRDWLLADDEPELGETVDVEG